jgi:hypothetical protein
LPFQNLWSSASLLSLMRFHHMHTCVVHCKYNYIVWLGYIRMYSRIRNKIVVKKYNDKTVLLLYKSFISENLFLLLWFYLPIITCQVQYSFQQYDLLLMEQLNHYIGWNAKHAALQECFTRRGIFPYQWCMSHSHR